MNKTKTIINLKRVNNFWNNDYIEYESNGDNNNKKVDIKEHNPNWPEIPDHHSYRILIVGGSGSGKTNALLNLINHELDIDQIYLYAKDPCEAKYQYY